MDKTSDDHPDVIVFPPLVLLATIVLGAALQWLMPLGLLAGVDRPWRFVAGFILLIAGVAFVVTARRTLVRRGTNVNPLQPTTALATESIYRWTRNPMYTGGTLAIIGLALIFAADWLVLLVVPSILVLHFGVVTREERYLEQKFGDDYRHYKARVPRYVWVG